MRWALCVVGMSMVPAPRTGYLRLESEGSPVEFKNIRVRELP